MKTSASEAIQYIKPGQRVFVHGSAATPTILLQALVDHEEIKDVELVFISVFGSFPPALPEHESRFRLNSLFVSGPVRKAVNSGKADYVPVFLSEIPELFRNNILPIDVALVQVSPPDRHGYCSLGVSVDVARSAVNAAEMVIALVNHQMPRTHGDGMIHTSRFAAMVECDCELELPSGHSLPGEIEQRIGRQVAGLIEDGSTLQLGIGAIPDSVLSCLSSHRHLGIHTEMFSDGILPLIQSGVIDNSLKVKHPGKTVTGFCFGTRKLYEFIDDNPGFAFLDIDYVNDTAVIRQNPRVIAINSAIEVDLTGQVCSDSIGFTQYSGVGGQMDFLRGAALSQGGKPIIALPSRTAKGQARIVNFLKPGAGVVATRAHIHYVVTEYGVAYLFGKNMHQRAQALIAIAHPDDRESLSRSFHDRFRH
ncbi:MAG: 4-hydroxybutyrate CoA-transferase [Sphingobacteriales bacterium]|jgi:acyl-CoA hydrolase|nr:4-hydroxybutyrate CoA-transferase [Sphingobacteriales bacterium]